MCSQALCPGPNCALSMLLLPPVPLRRTLPPAALGPSRPSWMAALIAAAAARQVAAPSARHASAMGAHCRGEACRAGAGEQQKREPVGNQTEAAASTVPANTHTHLRACEAVECIGRELQRFLAPIQHSSPCRQRLAGAAGTLLLLHLPLLLLDAFERRACGGSRRHERCQDGRQDAGACARLDE